MNKGIYIGAAVLIAAVVVLSTGGSKETLFQATVYKDANCGCCGIYANYLDKKGVDVNIIEGQTSNIKSSEGVPSSMKSCHTTLVGDYFVEGHVPLEAIQKLLAEQPDIKGIAMPGMPSGSPGMPGPKNGDFIIYSVNNDGSTEEFVRL